MVAGLNVRPDEYRRRFVIEFQDFESADMTAEHVKMLLMAFDIKSISRVDVEQMRQTPFFENLLDWDHIFSVLDTIAVPGSIRFGALDPALTRRDLERLQGQSRDPSKLYAPIRFVVFDFIAASDEDTMDSVTEQALKPDELNRERPPNHPPIKRTTLERLPTVFPRPPAPNAQNLKNAQQHYVVAAKDGGIDAVHVWDKPGGRGHGIRYVDIEYGWELRHPDLPTINDPFDGVFSYKVHHFDEKDHGVGMLGIISAQHDNATVYGIAPDAEAYVVSRLRAANIDNLPGAIMLACARLLRPGDVLLIEAQYPDSKGVLLPAQRDPGVFAAIQFGVNLGVTIIEPAGNSGVDLDDPIMLPASLRDSGAILVAAGMHDAAGVFDRWHGGGGLATNYGSVVHCFAWGGDLQSLTADLTKLHKVDQGATSGASAIIAGAAILVQSLYRAHFKGSSVIWPGRMRELLSDPSSGVQSKTGDIGVMPDLDTFFKLLSSRTQPESPPAKVAAPPALAEALGQVPAGRVGAPSDSPLLATFSSHATG